MLSPLPRRSVWAYCFAHFAQPCQPSPIWRSGRPAHRPFRGLLGVHSRYGLHTRAVTVYRDPLIRRLQPLRFLHSCSGCFRLERLPGGTCTHWKAPPFHGARHFQTHALQHSGIYSITSSAVLSNDAGISMPIALAVLSRFGASGTAQPSAPWRLREISSNRAAKAPAARQTTLTTVTAARRTSDSTRRA